MTESSKTNPSAGMSSARSAANRSSHSVPSASTTSGNFMGSSPQTSMGQHRSFCTSTRRPQQQSQPSTGKAPPKSITILGGGLTGLTTAYHLSKLCASHPSLQQIKITLIEKSSRLGGWVDSKPALVDLGIEGGGKTTEMLLESGPRSIRPRGTRGAVKMLKLVSWAIHARYYWV